MPADSSVNDSPDANGNSPAILGGTPLFPDGVPVWPQPADDVTSALHAAIADGSWGTYHGPHCDALAADIRTFLDCEHVELVCSGSAAVELALIGCKVSAGDEVIMSAYDYKTNFGNIVALNAVPVLVDIHPENGTLRADQISGSISDKTRVILVSHLHGGMVDMAAVRRVADEHSIPVIEDACQVTGGSVMGTPAGLSGDVGVWSFGGSKLMTGGRGGAVFSHNAQIHQRIRLHARRNNQVYPLSQIQAVAIRPQLARLRKDNEQRTKSVARLFHSLEETCPQILTPFRNGIECEPAWYKVGFRYHAAKDLPRDKFVQAVRAEGVALGPGFPALHLTHSRRRFRAAVPLEAAAAAHENYVALHHPVLLHSEEAIDKVAAAIVRVMNHAAEIRDSEA